MVDRCLLFCIKHVEDGLGLIIKHLLVTWVSLPCAFGEITKPGSLAASEEVYLHSLPSTFSTSLLLGRDAFGGRWA